MTLSPVDTAVILAAGNGRRLNDTDGEPPSKPLTRVGGMPLIVRTLAQLNRAGVRKAVVVVGYRAEELKVSLEGDPRLVGLEIVFADNAEWEKSNGVSVLAAADHIDGEFLVLMSDHVFDKSLLQGVLSEDARPDAGGAVLAVDRKISDIYDLPDCTLVKTDGRGRIVNIGKEIDDYDVADTGLFRCTPGLLDALQSVLDERGDCSLSDGIRLLGDRGVMRTHDIGDAWWQDVDTPGALKHAEDLLFNSCRKPVDGIVARHLNRNISLFFSRRLKDFDFSPNVVSVFNMGLGVAAFWAAIHPGYWWFLLAAFLLKANSVLDGVDGELARVRMQESKLGEWLDTIADDSSNLLFFAGLGIGASQLPGGAHFGVAGAVAVVAQIGLSFLLYRELIAKGSGDLYAVQWDFDDPDAPATLGSQVLGVLRYVVKQDFFILGFLVMAVFGVLPWCLYFAAAGGVGAFAAALARNAKLRAGRRSGAAA